MVGTYNPGMVMLSLVVAVLASYTALHLAARGVTRPLMPGLEVWRFVRSTIRCSPMVHSPSFVAVWLLAVL